MENSESNGNTRPPDLPPEKSVWRSKSNRNPVKHLLLLYYAKAFDHVDQNKLWKILQEMKIPDHLTCLLRNLYAAQIELDME